MMSNWINDDDPLAARRMKSRPDLLADVAAAERGRLLYWAATIVAGAIAALVVAEFCDNASRGMPIVSAAASFAACVAWLIGWAARHLIIDR